MVEHAKHGFLATTSRRTEEFGQIEGDRSKVDHAMRQFKLPFPALAHDKITVSVHRTSPSEARQKVRQIVSIVLEVRVASVNLQCPLV